MAVDTGGRALEQLGLLRRSRPPAERTVVPHAGGGLARGGASRREVRLSGPGSYESFGPQGAASRRSGGAIVQPVSFDQVNVPPAVYQRISVFVATLRL